MNSLRCGETVFLHPLENAILREAILNRLKNRGFGAKIVVLTCVCTSSDAATPSPLHTPLLPPRTTASTFAADDG